MNKVIVFSLMAIMAAFALTACSSNTAQSTVSKDLGLDVSKGKEVSNINTYSSGEGVSCIAIRFDDDVVLTAIKNDEKWKELPLDEVVQTLLYGVEDEASKVGPFLGDEDGKPLVPQIQNGYYLLIDRHWDKETSILERFSFNLTVGIYDLETDILYCLKLDT